MQISCGFKMCLSQKILRFQNRPVLTFLSRFSSEHLTGKVVRFLIPVDCGEQLSMETKPLEVF